MSSGGVLVSVGDPDIAEKLTAVSSDTFLLKTFTNHSADHGCNYFCVTVLCLGKRKIGKKGDR